jgi:hypothetical protein
LAHGIGGREQGLFALNLGDNGAGDFIFAGHYGNAGDYQRGVESRTDLRRGQTRVAAEERGQGDSRMQRKTEVKM